MHILGISEAMFWNFVSSSLLRILFLGKYLFPLILFTLSYVNVVVYLLIMLALTCDCTYTDTTKDFFSSFFGIRFFVYFDSSLLSKVAKLASLTTYLSREAYFEIIYQTMTFKLLFVCSS